MKTQVLWLIVVGVATFTLGVGLAGALPLADVESTAVLAQPALTDVAFQNGTDGNQVDGGSPDVLGVESFVADTVTYQGRLTAAGGALLNGTYTMRFQLYDVVNGGTALWDSGNLSIAVNNGLFNADLDVNHADFNGQALWLRIDVNGETLTPRQPLHPAAYALSLKPGADINGEPMSSSDAILGVILEGDWPSGQAVHGFSPSTGTAVYAQASGGQGLHAYSDDAYGVRGESDQSWGGYFSSNEGYAVYATTGGDDHWDHAGYFEASSGYGVYASSDLNMSIRGEAGDTAGLWQPVGQVGVVGIGQSRGLYGSSGSSYGIYGTSLDWYGIYGRTSRADNNYGLYTPDNLFSSNINLTGAVMNVAQNSGEEALEPGDVVVFSGLSQPLSANGSPVIQVAKATAANSQAVAGVVYSRFNIEVTVDEERDPGSDMEVTPAGPAPTGDYLLVVVQGPAQVKASAISQTIQAGDLLATDSSAGVASRAPLITLEGVDMAVPGTVFAKALESLNEGQELIYVFVTLH